MFFNAAKSLIYLKRSSLEFYRGNAKEELKFPPTVLQNIEIQDSETFEKLTITFLTNLKVKKQKIIIVLSEDLLFQKEIVTVDSEELKERSQNFLDSLPFASDKVVIKRVDDGQRKFIFATNKKIFKLLTEILESLDCEVKAIVPITLFKEKYKIDGELTADLAKKISSEENLLKRGNFLEDTPETPSGEHSSKIKLGLFLGIILLILVGIALLLIRSNLIENLKKESKVKLVSEVKKEGSESALPLESTKSGEIAKEELKIQVLNGTGIAGQAGKIKDMILELGFKEVETGNAEGTEESKTIVVFSQKVDSSSQEEIVDELEKIFASVSVKEATQAAEFDIIVTTGSYLE